MNTVIKTSVGVAVGFIFGLAFVWLVYTTITSTGQTNANTADLATIKNYLAAQQPPAK